MLPKKRNNNSILALIYDYFQENQQLREQNQEYQNLIKKQKEIIQNLIKNNGGKKPWQKNQESFLKMPKLEIEKQ